MGTLAISAALIAAACAPQPYKTMHDNGRETVITTEWKVNTTACDMAKRPMYAPDHTEKYWDKLFLDQNLQAARHKDNSPTVKPPKRMWADKNGYIHFDR